MTAKKTSAKKTVKKDKTPRVRRETAVFESYGRKVEVGKMKERLRAFRAGSTVSRVSKYNPNREGKTLRYRVGPGQRFASFKVNSKGALTLLKNVV